jgi:uncharacterized protein YbjT (DUF2867 family)
VVRARTGVSHHAPHEPTEVPSVQIAVTTPTGNVGRHVVPMLLRAGVRPRLLARDPDRLDPAIRGLVEAVAVDQRDPAEVAAATRGVDALFWVDPTAGGEDPLGAYDRATASVAHAVSENRIGRVVFQSSVGAEKRRGVGEIDGLARTEEALDASGAAVTHLRCGFFFTNLNLQLEALRAGTVPVAVRVDQPMPWVAPRDIAEVAVGRLLSAEWSGRCVQAVHGPEDLSWRGVAAIISETTGRDIQARQIADETMAELLRAGGMSDALAAAVLEMSTGMRDDFVPEQPRTALSTTPTPLAAWVYSELRHRL